MTDDSDAPCFYGELATWWPLISPYEDRPPRELFVARR